jgi:hypothetical protein
MSTTAPVRIPVCNSDEVIIDRVCLSRASRIALAPNARVVRFGHSRKRKRGEIARIVLREVGDCSLDDSMYGNPRAYSHKRETETNPENCWTLKRIPTDTAALFDTAVLDCMARPLNGNV